MSAPAATSVAAALLAILIVPLSLLVSAHRLRLGGVVFGDAGDEGLRRRIRAHGNFTEYAPTLLLTLALVELAGAPAAFVTALAVAVVGGRLLHAVGMLWFETPAPRGVAMLATHGVYLLGGGWLLWHFA